MSSVMPEWYGGSDDSVAHIVTTGTIALDANVMLDLYRVGRDQREEILTVLESLRDRLFIPYQAAYEFQSNRTQTAGDAISTFERIRDNVTTALQEVNLSAIRDDVVQEQIRDTLAKAAKRAARKLDKLRDEHTVPFEDTLKADPIREAVDALIDNGATLGSPPSAEDRKTAVEEFKRRAADRIPPGYKDADKPKNAPGDYLIWLELIDHATTNQRPTLFVTNDRKEDWYRPTVRDAVIGPRAELTAEMLDRAGQAYHQVPLDVFLELAVEHLEATVDDATIDAVERISRPIYSSPTAMRDLMRNQSPLLNPQDYIGSGVFDSPAMRRLAEQATSGVPALWADRFGPTSALFGQDVSSPLSALWANPAGEHQYDFLGDIAKTAKDYVSPLEYLKRSEPRRERADSRPTKSEDETPPDEPSDESGR